MSLALVETLVRTRIGLDASSLGGAFPRAVEARMRARGVTSGAAYAGLLAADPAEWAVLAEDLVVPESWFFRGGSAYFQQLARWLRGRATSRGVRALSAPCGSGEEPYSLAIALAEEGVPPSLIRIDGVDLSPGQVGRAEAARYPAFSFREPGADPRPRYFHEAGGRWELDRAVRAPLRFRAGNLVTGDALAGEAPYDLILCRNLFIYLTDEARARAVANLHRLLAPGGRLYLTPAEADRLDPTLFAPDGPAVLAGFRRSDDPGVRPAEVPPSARTHRASDRPVSPYRPRPAPPVGRAEYAARPVALPPLAVAPPVPPPAPPHADATRARALADAGRLDEARAVCERAVAATPAAELYSLLGVVHLAAGRAADAEEAFRRALYLTPDHREALTHMVMLYDRRGDRAPAAGLRRRLARLPEATA
jgi:chemotaxis protein methyltransferase WspC